MKSQTPSPAPPTTSPSTTPTLAPNLRSPSPTPTPPPARPPKSPPPTPTVRSRTRSPAPPLASRTPSLSSAASVAAAHCARNSCFNPDCKGPKSPVPCRKGWRLRSGEFADICLPCTSIYEQGRFCESFHTNFGGWRNCETCGKRIHCGCIVSASTYTLLDRGGIECVTCVFPVPKQILPSPLLHPSQVSEGHKEFSAKGRHQLIGSSPGEWRQASNLYNVARSQPELHRRLAYEFHRPSLTEKLLPAGRSVTSLHEKKIEDLSARIVPSSSDNATPERCAKGVVNMDSVSAIGEGKSDCIQKSGHLSSENDIFSSRRGLILSPSSTASRVNCEAHPNSCVDSRPSLSKEDSTSPFVGTAAPIGQPVDPKDSIRISTSQPNRQTSPPPVKQIYPNSHNLLDRCAKLQAHIRDGQPQTDAQSQSQLLPRNWPRSTDQELHRISRESVSKITPLFEKMLSASDTGRRGCLLLPRKCVEAYFPPISHPEGLPLVVQDATGNEWVLQLRFWSNNNRKKYVLDGVAPCIQSMQLQAGDTVVFSRKDPEGKLVMGCRKASNTLPEQENQTLKSGNGSSTPPDVNDNITSEHVLNFTLQPFHSSPKSRKLNNTDEQGTCSKSDKSDLTPKNGPPALSLEIPCKEKGSLGSTGKHLRIGHEDSIQLKLTWEAAQDLLRPPNRSPNVVTVEGHVFEEYKEAPLIGMPTFLSTNQEGGKCQWIQCDSCSKWRKLPVDALLPAIWTCSDNDYDCVRSSCSVAQELTMEQLAGFLPVKTGMSKRSRDKKEKDGVEVSNGLDRLANLTLGEDKELPPSSQTARKHPRHRLGCTCIVCSKPPKGPKHSRTCSCIVCATVRGQLGKECEDGLKQEQQQQQLNQLAEISPIVGHESETRKSLPSLLNDLNIQREREKEPSPMATTSRETYTR